MPQWKTSEGVARGAIGASLIVLEGLKENYRLDLEDHLTEGRGQIKGISGNALANVLAQFGETRTYLKEVGRTNRGTINVIKTMLECLKTLRLEDETKDSRVETLKSLQGVLVQRVQDYFNQQRLKMEYDPTKTTWIAVSGLLERAKKKGKDGAVAQYLVGAKLALRFPKIEIENFSYSTADTQLGRPGDFYVGNTAFHVTVSPLEGVFDRCRANVQHGLRVYLLVPDSKLAAARQIAADREGGKVAVESIESFVSQNVEEIAEFSGPHLHEHFGDLLRTYNERVGKIESDRSLLIEIPANLEK